MKDCSLRYSYSDKGQCHAFFNCLLGEIEFLSGVHTEEFRIATPQFAAHQPLIYTRNDGDLVGADRCLLSPVSEDPRLILR